MIHVKDEIVQIVCFIIQGVMKVSTDAKSSWVNVVVAQQVLAPTTPSKQIPTEEVVETLEANVGTFSKMLWHLHKERTPMNRTNDKPNVVHNSMEK